MPTIEEVDEFILEWIATACRAPRMFASCPSGFEDVLVELDRVRGFLHDQFGSTGFPDGKGYLNYLSTHGFDVATVSGRLEIDFGGTIADPEVYDAIVHAWQQYMASDFRID